MLERSRFEGETIEERASWVLVVRRRCAMDATSWWPTAVRKIISIRRENYRGR